MRRSDANEAVAPSMCATAGMTSDCGVIEPTVSGRPGVVSETLSGTDAIVAPVLAFVTLTTAVDVPGGSEAGPTTAVSTTPVGGRVPVGGVTETNEPVEVAV